MKALIQKYWLAWTTVALIVGLALIVSTTGVALYQTYKTDTQIKKATQLCTDMGGYITFGTDGGYSGSLKSTKTQINLVPTTNNTLYLSCSPTGSSRLTVPGGGTLLPSSVIDEDEI
ncbi:hypothetical protein AB1K09_00995 [Solibacillus silvestris]